MPYHDKRALVGELRLHATFIQSPSWCVRIFDNVDSNKYSRTINVEIQDDGRELYLSSWIGDLPTRAQWRAAAKRLFPRARVVAWHRLLEDGTFKAVRLPIYSGSNLGNEAPPANETENQPSDDPEPE